MILCRVSSALNTGSAWDQAMENSLIQQSPSTYGLSEIPSTSAAVSSQRLQDFNWSSAVKSESVSGQ